MKNARSVPNYEPELQSPASPPESEEVEAREDFKVQTQDEASEDYEEG